MVDIIKTKAELIADYADQETRAIVANTHRNAVVSYMSCTGQLVDPNGPASFTTTPAAVSFVSGGAASGGVTDDGLFDYLEIGAGADGIYLMGVSLALQYSGPNTNLLIGIFIDGSQVGTPTTVPIKQNEDFSANTTVLTRQLVAGNQIQVGISVSSGTGTPTWIDGHFFLSRQASEPVS